MALYISYAVNVQASKSIGTTVADKSTDTTNSLHQALNNNVASGVVFKMDIELSAGESQTINIGALGIPFIRSILIKSDNQFGYCVMTTNQTINNEPYWHLVRTAFIDFNTKPVIGINNKYRPDESLSVIRVESPTVTHPPANAANLTPTITVQLLIIGS